MSSEAPEVFTLSSEPFNRHPVEIQLRGVLFRRADLVEQEIAERDAEIARLQYYVGECLRLQEELAAERQRARLPGELVEQLRKQHRLWQPGWPLADLIRDILAWHDRVEQKENEE